MLGAHKIEMIHVTTALSGMHCHLLARTCYYQHAYRFEVSYSLSIGRQEIDIKRDRQRDRYNTELHVTTELTNTY